MENGSGENNIYLTSLHVVFCKNTIYLKIARISGSGRAIGQYTALMNKGISKEFGGYQSKLHPKHRFYN